MKLFRFRVEETVKPGVILNDGTRVDVSQYTADYDQYFFENKGISRLDEWVKENRTQLPVVAENVEKVAPICLPRRVICVENNFIRSTGDGSRIEKKEPSISINPIHERRKKNKDYFLEDDYSDPNSDIQLAIVLSQRASYLRDVNTWDYVAGYILYCPAVERPGSRINHLGLGPMMVTRDEIKNVHGTKLYFQPNGDVVQEIHSHRMVAKIPEIVSYLSEYINLVPGEIIAIGAPAGLGMPHQVTEARAA